MGTSPMSGVPGGAKVPALLSRRLTAALAVSACAVAAAPASAAPTYRSAAFKAELHGTQVSTWEYHEDTLKDDPCGSKIDDYGDQTLKYSSSTKGMLLAGKQGSKPPTLTLYRPGKSFAPYELLTEAQRNGTTVVDTGQDRSRCADNGGGVEPGRQDKDCGLRYGWLTPDLEAVGGGPRPLGGPSSGFGDPPLQALRNRRVPRHH